MIGCLLVHSSGESCRRCKLNREWQHRFFLDSYRRFKKLLAETLSKVRNSATTNSCVFFFENTLTGADLTTLALCELGKVVVWCFPREKCEVLVDQFASVRLLLDKKPENNVVVEESTAESSGPFLTEVTEKWRDETAKRVCTVLEMVHFLFESGL